MDPANAEGLRETDGIGGEYHVSREVGRICRSKMVGVDKTEIFAGPVTQTMTP